MSEQYDEWAQKLFEWEERNGLSTITRNKDNLLNIEDLSFVNINYFEKDKVTDLPKEIGELVQLTHLGLGNAAHPEIYITNITRLPDEVGKLINLESIHMQFNSIKELPKEIGGLTKLKELKLGGNKLRSLPKEIGNLHELEVLTLWSNDIARLPAEIGNLQKLKGLDISGNKLSELPKEIIKLTNLKTFYYTNAGLQLNDLQRIWIKRLESNGCEF